MCNLTIHFQNLLQGISGCIIIYHLLLLFVCCCCIVIHKLDSGSVLKPVFDEFASCGNSYCANENLDDEFYKLIHCPRR